jgi:hypothetical protein
MENLAAKPRQALAKGSVQLTCAVLMAVVICHLSSISVSSCRARTASPPSVPAGVKAAQTVFDHHDLVVTCCHLCVCVCVCVCCQFVSRKDRFPVGVLAGVKAAVEAAEEVLTRAPFRAYPLPPR